MAPSRPVRVVVLNFNGGDTTRRCLAHLRQLDWPGDELEVVVVDNGSTDGSADALQEEFPDVEVRRLGRNVGFPGNNAALVDLSEVRYVALLNNDAFVEPGWLAPLVETLDRDPDVGAACPKLVLAPRFAEVALSAPGFRPGGGDDRELGVKLRGLTVDGEDRWSDLHVVGEWWGMEEDRDGQFLWLPPDATVRVPVCALSAHARFEVESGREVDLRVDGGSGAVTVPVGRGTTHVDVTVRGPAYDVLNNVGSLVYTDGAGADRGWLERDEGQYDRPEEVFAWCGGSVLLRPEYLADVGLFDERFFLYYEDTDLSWRGRARGWRYRTAPSSVVRHLHAASSGEGSPVFEHHVERNRLLMLVKDAPAAMAVREVWRYLLVTASYTRRDVVAPLRRGGRPLPRRVRRRLASFLDFLALLPAMLGSRRELRRAQLVPDAELRGWLVSR